MIVHSKIQVDCLVDVGTRQHADCGRFMPALVTSRIGTGKQGVEQSELQISFLRLLKNIDHDLDDILGGKVVSCSYAIHAETVASRGCAITAGPCTCPSLHVDHKELVDIGLGIVVQDFFQRLVRRLTVVHTIKHFRSDSQVGLMLGIDYADTDA